VCRSYCNLCRTKLSDHSVQGVEVSNVITQSWILRASQWRSFHGDLQHSNVCMCVCVCVCVSFCERNDSQQYVISIPGLYGSKFHFPHTDAVCFWRLSQFVFIAKFWKSDLKLACGCLFFTSFLIHLTAKISTGLCVYNETKKRRRMCKHRCRGKAISLTYYECVCSLGYPACERNALYYVICGLSVSTIFFHITS